MAKIVVLSCTNRPDSNTLKVSRIYEKILKGKGVDTRILDFCELPHDIAFSETFGKRTKAYTSLIQEYVSSFSKFIFVVPEYNGSFPGILKTFLDSVPPREWANKDACLVGVADGRAGNLRGMEHMTNILHYLKVHVLYNKLPISRINEEFDKEGNVLVPATASVIEQQIEEFLKF